MSQCVTRTIFPFSAELPSDTNGTSLIVDAVWEICLSQFFILFNTSQFHNFINQIGAQSAYPAPQQQAYPGYPPQQQAYPGYPPQPQYGQAAPGMLYL